MSIHSSAFSVVQRPAFAKARTFGHESAPKALGQSPSENQRTVPNDGVCGSEVHAVAIASSRRPAAAGRRSSTRADLRHASRGDPAYLQTKVVTVMGANEAANAPPVTGMAVVAALRLSLADVTFGVHEVGVVPAEVRGVVGRRDDTRAARLPRGSPGC